MDKCLQKKFEHLAYIVRDAVLDRIHGLDSAPPTTPRKSDLRMNIWVQITDLSPTSSPKCKAYGMLIVYTWQYIDGNRIKYVKDSVRAIRSAVQTF